MRVFDMTRRFIGISGKQFAGKDALADLLLERLPGYRKLPLAAAIKQAYCLQHGITLAELEAHKAEHRPGLIQLGDWGRDQDPDFWLRQVLNEPGYIIIPDVRMQREYLLLREHRAFLVRVEADRSVRGLRGRLVSEDDRTECDLDTVTDWDALITNNAGRDQLAKSADALATRIVEAGYVLV
jgi:phosphomevalonate kinase